MLTDVHLSTRLNSGRFQEEFVESRRVGLEHFIRKVVAHPALQEDADLRAFLESETFLADVWQPCMSSETDWMRIMLTPIFRLVEKEGRRQGLHECIRECSRLGTEYK